MVFKEHSGSLNPTEGMEFDYRLRFNVAYGVNFLTRVSPTLSLFGNSSYTMYDFPERSSDEENIKHHKYFLPASCKSLGGKTYKRSVYIHNHGLETSNFTKVEERSIQRERYYIFSNVCSDQRYHHFSAILSKIRKKVYFLTSRLHNFGTN